MFTSVQFSLTYCPADCWNEFSHWTSTLKMHCLLFIFNFLTISSLLFKGLWQIRLVLEYVHLVYGSPHLRFASLLLSRSWQFAWHHFFLFFNYFGIICFIIFKAFWYEFPQGNGASLPACDHWQCICLVGEYALQFCPISQGYLYSLPLPIKVTIFLLPIYRKC